MKKSIVFVAVTVLLVGVITSYTLAGNGKGPAAGKGTASGICEMNRDGSCLLGLTDCSGCASEMKAGNGKGQGGSAGKGQGDCQRKRDGSCDGTGKGKGQGQGKGTGSCPRK